MIIKVDITDFCKTKFNNDFSYNDSFFSNTLESFLLNNQLIIAGGFARNLANHFILDINPEKYFKSVFDIDFFNTKPELNVEEIVKTHNRNNERVIRNHLSTGSVDLEQMVQKEADIMKAEFEELIKSVFCYCSYSTNTVYLDESGSVNEYLTIKNYKTQVVTSYQYNSIEELFNDFDLINCRFAILKKENKLYLYYDEKALEAEKQKILLPNYSSDINVFFLERVLKYMERGLKFQKNNKNKEIINEWFFKFATNSFNQNEIDIWFRYFQEVIQNNINCGLFEKNNIAVLVNKFKHIIYEGDQDPYSYFTRGKKNSKVVDWASYIIKRLNNEN